MHSTIPNINSSTLIFVIPEEEWRNLHDTLKQIMDLIARRNVDDANSEWIESEDARKILGVSPKTWQNYRDKHIIPFSQIGRKTTSIVPTSTPSSENIVSRYKIANF